METTPEKANREVSSDSIDDVTMADATLARLSDDDLPTMPGIPELGDEDSSQALRDLLAFHLYGRRPGKRDAAHDANAIPALLYRYRDLSGIRHDYPVCVDGYENGRQPETLSQIIDDILASIAKNGDEGEHIRRDIYRLEAVMRSVTEHDPGQQLSVVWGRAATSLMSILEPSGDSKERITGHIAMAREALDVDGELLPCSAQTATRLFKTIGMLDWRERTRVWSDELETLIENLKAILIVDDEHSEAALSPEHLNDSLGADDDEVDASAMSRILSDSPHGDRLPDVRRKRIEQALSMLNRMRPVFDTTAKGDAPFDVSKPVDSCQAARGEYAGRQAAMIEFFKSVRIARMESSNGYREELHDAFFKRFDTTCLTDDELRLFPPILVMLAGGRVRDEIESLLDILAQGLPVKVLMTLDDLCASSDGSSIGLGWAARVPNLAIALNTAYVLQAPVSDLGIVRPGLVSGFAYDGPALFGIYTGEKQVPSGYSAYLAAAAATEARALPVIEFNPGAGEKMADRISISANPHHEEDWPAGPFRCQTEGEEERNEELQFTTADFLYFDPRLRRHFWCVEPKLWHDDMVTVAEYLEMPAEEASSKVPYVVAVDGDRDVTRVVVTREVMNEVRRQRDFWRGVQESGGVKNSFAERLVDEARERMETEKEQEIEAIEQRYVEQLEQDLGDLTKEIVNRIATGLMSGEGFEGVAPSADASASRPAAPAPAAEQTTAAEAAAPEAAPEVEEAPAEEEEDEDIGGLDDPYIDTPLCTTCNECTGINSQVFAYNENKQAIIKNPDGGPYKDLVRAAELCPVHIIHPGKPRNKQEPDLDEWIKRGEKYN